MSADERVTKDLVETLEDGAHGYSLAAERVRDDRPEVAERFTALAEQRTGFSQELQGLAADYGDKVDEGGSAVAALHRGWLSLKDALSGKGIDGVLDAVSQGENHAVKEYEKALGEDISDGLRTVADRQLGDIRAALDEADRLRNA